MLPIVHVHFNRPSLASPRKELEVYTRELLSACLIDMGFHNSEVSVLFCSGNYIHRLNAEHLMNDKETDVLSFPAEPNVEPFRGGDRFYLGDIALCLKVCAHQAAEVDNTLCDEVSLLLVHGLLHLLGYDHDTAHRKDRMWGETDRLLRLASPIARPHLEMQTRSSNR